MNKKRIVIPIFTRGKQVWFNGRPKTVESILISKQRLLVKLEDVYDVVDSEDLHCEPTVFTYEERPR